MSLVISDQTEKKLDAVLDNANALVTEVRGKLGCIDATELAGAIVQLNQTAANLLAVSEKLKIIAEKF